MTLLATTFGVCLMSAVFPVVNAEAYLGALAAVGMSASLWPLAVTAALGQTLGKVAFFHLGRSSMSWGWVRRKTESPMWHARLARWQTRTETRPGLVTWLVGGSAVLGLPPLAVMSVVAGQLRASLPWFVVAVFAGRTLRFAALLGMVGTLDLS